MCACPHVGPSRWCNLPGGSVNSRCRSERLLICCVKVMAAVQQQLRLAWCRVSVVRSGHVFHCWSIAGIKIDRDRHCGFDYRCELLSTHAIPIGTVRKGDQGLCCTVNHVFCGWVSDGGDCSGCCWRCCSHASRPEGASADDLSISNASSTALACAYSRCLQFWVGRPIMLVHRLGHASWRSFFLL